MEIIFYIIGTLFLLYFILINLFFSGIIFSWFYLLLGISFIFYNKFISYLNIKNLQKLSLFFKSFIIVGIFIFTLFQLVIIFYPKNEKVESDYIIILGAGIKGKEISLTLKDRLDKALELADEINFKGKFILSGGKGKNEEITEAEAMENYLLANGIDKEIIIKENEAKSTYENLKFSKFLIEEDSNNNISNLKISVVTTDFHAFRSKVLSKRNGYSNIKFYTSDSKLYLIPTSYAREFFAFGKSLLFDKEN